MDAFEAIAARRSIRHFRPDPVPDEIITRLLSAASQAPSGKNRQPWHFAVVRSPARREEMLSLMRAGIAEARAEGADLGSTEGSARVMAEAPVTVFVYNPLGKRLIDEHSVGEMVWEVVDDQSIGAAIQNLCLAATALGLGTLWICDVFVAYEPFCAWLGHTGPVIAAVSIGYPDEAPPPRPRHSLEETVTWI